MKTFAAAPMWCAMLILLLLGCASCSVFKSKHKETATADSSVVRKESIVRSIEMEAKLEHKKISITNDTAISDRDSLKSSFTFNPSAKDTVKVKLTGSLLGANLWFLPSLGIGEIEVTKQEEKIRVKTFTEETTTATLTHRDTSSHQLDEKKKVKTVQKKTDTEVKRNTSAGTLLWIVIILVVILFLYSKYKRL